MTSRVPVGSGSDQERSGESAAVPKLGAMGQGNFRGRFQKHRWLGGDRDARSTRKLVRDQSKAFRPGKMGLMSGGLDYTRWASTSVGFKSVPRRTRNEADI